MPVVRDRYPQHQRTCEWGIQQDVFSWMHPTLPPPWDHWHISENGGLMRRVVCGPSYAYSTADKPVLQSAISTAPLRRFRVQYPLPTAALQSAISTAPLRRCRVQYPLRRCRVPYPLRHCGATECHIHCATAVYQSAISTAPLRCTRVPYQLRHWGVPECHPLLVCMVVWGQLLSCVWSYVPLLQLHGTARS